MRRASWMIVAAWVLAATSPMASAKTAGRLMLVELVNFSCPHCRVESTYIPQVVSAMRGTGGRIEVAPLEPAPGAEPAPSVLAYYAELTAYPHAGIRAANALYSGYEQGAALDSARSALSWLNLQGLPTAKAYALLGSPDLHARWARALRLAGLVHATSYPTFVAINRHTGYIERVFRWHGHAGKLAASVVRYFTSKLPRGS